jgi:hypothetical protein
MMLFGAFTQSLVIPGMNATAFTRRCALLRASKDEYGPWPILRGSPSGASAPQGSHLRMTAALTQPSILIV